MSAITTEEEFEEHKSIVDKTESICRLLWNYGRPFANPPKSFRKASGSETWAGNAWQAACDIYHELTGDDPQKSLDLCNDFLNNPKMNPDFSEAYKASINND